MNLVILTGNLVKDCEIQSTKKEGKSEELKFIRNTLAVKRSYKNSNNEYETDFFDFVLFNSTDYAVKYGKKGSLCEIVGELKVNKFTNKENKEVRTLEIQVNQINFKPKETKEKEEEAKNE